jgi:SAM-dependent methyltransferase
MVELNARDDTTRRAWVGALRSHQLLYPDERVVSFLARRFGATSANRARHALDIGCGSGRHIQLLLDYGFQTTGIDYASDAVAMVNAACAGHPQFRGVVHGDFRAHRFAHRFDAMVSWGVVFLVPPSEMIPALQSMAMLLAPAGRLLVNFRTRENWHYGLGQEVEPGCFLLDHRAGAYAGMCYSFLDLPDVESLLDQVGTLDIVHVEQTTFRKRNLTELHSWLQVELAPRHP